MKHKLLKRVSGMHGMVDRNFVLFIVGDKNLAREIDSMSQSPTVLLEVEDEFDVDSLAERIREARRDEDDSIVIVAGDRLLEDSFIRAFADYTLAISDAEESRADETWRRIEEEFELIPKSHEENSLTLEFESV